MAASVINCFDFLCPSLYALNFRGEVFPGFLKLVLPDITSLLGSPTLPNPTLVATYKKRFVDQEEMRDEKPLDNY